MDQQMGLFGSTPSKEQAKAPLFQKNSHAPLAHRARPDKFEDFVGWSELSQKYPFLASNEISGLIIWGPPGTGKTTLAHLLAKNSDKELYFFNAVLGGVNDLRKLIARAEEVRIQMGKDAIIFIDEIHRFNKAQQDALLPYVESGAFSLIGATTENPRVSVNRALLSRVHIMELPSLNFEQLQVLLSNICLRHDILLSEEIISFLADHADGDGRRAINTIELAKEILRANPEAPIEDIKQVVLENARAYDRQGNRHYDVISAFIKSMRGTDPDAALLWLAVMIDGGEDPVFIARRLVIFASEDIGNADPTALTLAVATLQAVQNIGMPEARINLGQTTSYLASTVKSNKAYKAMDAALEYVRERDTIPVPDHLKNFPPKDAKAYLYPHAYEGHFVEQEYTVGETPSFYRPSELGVEGKLKKRLGSLARRTTE